MKKDIREVNQSKLTTCCETAQSLFVAGLELPEIAKKLKVGLETLEEWQRENNWEKRKELVAEHPQLLSEALRGLVKEKVNDLLAKKELNPSNVDELNKLLGLIERLAEQSWDERAAVVTVMGLFGSFVRRQVGEKKELQRLTKLMGEFFEEMEGT